MNIWLNISFQIPEAHLSHTSSKFSSHLMQPDNISANTGTQFIWPRWMEARTIFFIYIFRQLRKRLQPLWVTVGRPVTYIGEAHLTGEAAARKHGRGRALGIYPSLQISSHSWQSSSLSGPLVPIWLVIRCTLDTRGREAEWTRINWGDHDGVWWAAFNYGGVTLIPPRLCCHVKTEMKLPSREAERVRTDLTFASDAFAKRHHADEGSVL